MKKRLFLASLALCVLLAGCSMLDDEYTFRDYLGNMPYADEINDAVMEIGENSESIERPSDVKFPEYAGEPDNTENTQDHEEDTAADYSTLKQRNRVTIQLK